MENYHFGLVKFVGNHQNLLNLLLDVGNFVFRKINDFVYLYEEVQMFVVYLHSYNCVLQNCF